MGARITRTTNSITASKRAAKETYLPNCNGISNPLDWDAVRDAAKIFLLSGLRVSDEGLYRSEKEGIQAFATYVHGRLSSMTNHALENALKGRKEDDTYEAYLTVIRLVEPFCFWPDLTIVGHPSETYYKGFYEAVNRRFGRPHNKLPSILVEVLDLEYLQLPSAQAKEAINVMVQWGEALLRAAGRHYGKPASRLSWEQIDSFEATHAEASLEALVVMADR